ncbi:MAG: hypothetical protein GQ569_01245 [Methylococcaceae bacterium]|nr:hypothetical protein [Methylococcaceae bacterium]
MGKIRKSTPKAAKAQNDIILLHTQLQKQRLIDLNRYLISAVFILMTMVFVLGFFVVPDKSDLAAQLKDKQQLVDYAQKNPAISAEVDNLKGELVGLVSGSIESKLKSLEEGIKLQSVLGSLQTLEEVRNDMKVLRKYSDPLEQQQQQVAAANVALLEEVSQLRNLIYLTLGSCSLMFSAALLIWVKNRKRLTHQKQDDAYLANIKEDV